MNIYTLHKEGSFQPPTPDGDSEIIGLLQSTIRKNSNNNNNTLLPTVVEETSTPANENNSKNRNHQHHNNQNQHQPEKEKSSSSNTSITSRTGVETVSSSGEKTTSRKNSFRDGTRRLDEDTNIDAAAAAARINQAPSSPPLGAVPSNHHLLSLSSSLLANRHHPNMHSHNQNHDDWKNRLYSSSSAHAQHHTNAQHANDAYNNNYQRFSSSLIEIQAKNEFMVFDNDTDVISHLTNPPEIRTSPLEDRYLVIDHNQFAVQDDLVSTVSLPRALTKKKSTGSSKNKSGSTKKKNKTNSNSNSNKSSNPKAAVIADANNNDNNDQPSDDKDDIKRLERKSSKKKKKSSTRKKQKSADKLQLQQQQLQKRSSSTTRISANANVNVSVGGDTAREQEQTKGGGNNNDDDNPKQSQPVLRAEEDERQHPKVRLSTFCNESDLHDNSNNDNSTTHTSSKSNGSSGKSGSKKSRSTRRGGKRRGHRNSDPHQQEQEQQEEITEHQGQSLFRRTSAGASSSSGGKNANADGFASGTEKTRPQQDNAHAHHNAEEARSDNGKKQHERQKKLGNRTSSDITTASKTSTKTALTSLQVAMLFPPPDGADKKSKTTIGDHLKTISATSTATTVGNTNGNPHRSNSLDGSNKSGRTGFHEIQPDLGTNPTLSSLSLPSTCGRSLPTEKRRKTKKWFQRPSFHHKKKKKQQQSTSDRKLGKVSGHSSSNDKQQQPPTRNRRRSW